MSSAPPEPQRARHLPFQLLVIYFLLLKVWFDLAVPAMGDESYYWMYGQRLELSYFDHPPLHGWLLALVSLIFGWHPISVRLLTWFCLAGTTWVFWEWAKRLQPDDPQRYFWRTSALYLATPIFWLMTTMAFNDYLLISLCFASMHFWLLFTDAWAGGERRYRWLYVAAAFLGLATLTKYNGIFLGLGFALMVFARRPLRSLLRSPHTYLAALLAVAMQFPVLWWNITEGMASFRFHLGSRITGSLDNLNPNNALTFFANMLLSLSPFLFAAMLRMPFKTVGNSFERNARALGLSTFTVSTLTMLVLSLFVYIFFYWNIIAYLALIPVALHYLGGRWLYWLHAAFGAIMALVLAVNFAVYPLANIVGPKDWGTSANYGWDELAAVVGEQRQLRPDAFLAGTRYTYAAQLGYQLRTANVTSINAGPTDQYDFWTDREALRGKDAIIVADGAFPIDFARTQFGTMDLLTTVTVTRFGTEVTTYEIWHGHDYMPTE
jgi:4-amino-4-deoxy-L-arabinose transferase-like glycosyltransferase